jgi:hypothetical protein
VVRRLALLLLLLLHQRLQRRALELSALRADSAWR